MKYYKLNSKVYAFESDGSQDEYITKEMRLMTKYEIDKHTNPNKYLTEEERYQQHLATLKPLTRRQFKLTLLNEGLLQQVEIGINNIEDATERARMQIEYTEANEFHRTSEAVATMITLLGSNEDQVNTMWEKALTY